MEMEGPVNAFDRRGDRGHSAFEPDREGERRAQDTIPEPEMAVRIAIASAFGDRRREKTTADCDPEVLEALLGADARARSHKTPKSTGPRFRHDPVPPALLVRRRSTEPPLPRHEDEDE
jgi:hypothetical protein